MAVRVIPVCGIHCCKNVNCGVVMNRDYNAAINICRNLLHYINTGDWLPQFSKKAGEKNESQQEQQTPATATSFLQRSLLV